MRKYSFLVVLLLNSLIFLPLSLHAQPAPYSQQCRSFKGGKDFVGQASLFCLKKSNQRSCERAARVFFEQCGFEGDYEELSQEIHRRMLVAVIMARVDRD